jgi:hypothetical protein
MSRRQILLLLIPVSLGVAITCYILWFVILCPLTREMRSAGGTVFDRDEWLARTPNGFTACMCDRGGMGEDLVRRKLLIGAPRAQVVEWLGAPVLGLPGGQDDGTKAYFVSYVLNRSEWLVVQFDPADRVSATRISGGD